jgi:hypothetical protein
MKLMKPVLATALITVRVVFAVLILGDGWADTEGHVYACNRVRPRRSVGRRGIEPRTIGLKVRVAACQPVRVGGA